MEETFKTIILTTNYDDNINSMMKSTLLKRGIFMINFTQSFAHDLHTAISNYFASELLENHTHTTETVKCLLPALLLFQEPTF